MPRSRIRRLGLIALFAIAIVVLFGLWTRGTTAIPTSDVSPPITDSASTTSLPGSQPVAAEQPSSEAIDSGHRSQGSSPPYTGTVSPVSAEFALSVDSGTAPLTVSFVAAASTKSNGQVALWEWSFGDGFEATGPEVSHTYQASGEYEVRLLITDSSGFESAASHNVLVTKTDSPERELVDYAVDPGFESGHNGFVNYYEKSSTERTSEQPLTGASSLVVDLPGWSNAILPVTYPWHEGPNGYSLTASAEIRVDEMTTATVAELCAVAYWDTDGQETRHESCTEFSAADNEDNEVETVAATLVLDPEQRLGRVYLWLSYSQNGNAIVTIDNAHLILDKVLQQ